MNVNVEGILYMGRGREGEKSALPSHATPPPPPPPSNPHPSLGTTNERAVPAVEHSAGSAPNCRPTTSPLPASVQHVTLPVKRAADGLKAAAFNRPTSVASAALVALIFVTSDVLLVGCVRQKGGESGGGVGFRGTPMTRAVDA